MSRRRKSEPRRGRRRNARRPEAAAPANTDSEQPGADQILDEIRQEPDLAKVVSNRLFGQTPTLFEGDRDLWVDWRYELAAGLDVDDHGILLVGSAALGVSLNPEKGFRPFGEHSDIDVAVLSQRHFDSAWFELRELRDRRWASVPLSVRNELRQYAPNYVFAGSIALDRLLGRLSFGKAWLEALTQMATVDPTVDRRIRVRLYRDAEALRWYQMRGLRIARETLDGGI
jgi:hypothetical protein